MTTLVNEDRPVVLALDQDEETLGVVEDHLRRYANDYRVECLADPATAQLRLEELTGGDDVVALVLAANSGAVAAPTGFLEHVRQLHPHARSALVVPSGVWADPLGADAIRASIALGRAHYYVARPAGRRDEVFHAAVSNLSSRVGDRTQSGASDCAHRGRELVRQGV